MKRKVRTIDEGNRVIAEFMGWVVMEGTAGQCYESTAHPFDTMHIDDFKYWENWNALMPVIERINWTGKAGGILYDLYDALKTADIIATWRAVIEFIEWYNSITTPNKENDENN